MFQPGQLSIQVINHLDSCFSMNISYRTCEEYLGWVKVLIMEEVAGIHAEIFSVLVETELVKNCQG